MIRNTSERSNGFTLVEFLVGITMTALIFIVATNLMIGFLSVNTKSKRSQEVEQAKSDITSELTEAMQWATDVNFENGELTVDANKYKIVNGAFTRNDAAFTNKNAVVTNFEVKEFSNSIEPQGSGNGLFGNYFNSANFTNLVATQIDPIVDFNWGFERPVPTVGKDSFSVEWTGQIKIPSAGTYTFYITSDDGARLTVDSKQVVNNFNANGLSSAQGNIAFASSKMVSLRLQYHENFSQSRVSLYWSGPGFSKTIIPTAALYAQSTQPGFEVNIDLKHAESDNVRDTLRLFISPRFNN